MNDDELAKKTAKAQRATQPGAVAVAADEAERLDQRIAEKRNNSNKSVEKQLNQVEQDVKAKSRAKPAAGAAAPGAYAAAAPSGRTDLSALENDVIAKARAAPSSRNELATLENDVRRKTRAGPRATQPGAHAELSSLESAVAAKSSPRSQLQGMEADIHFRHCPQTQARSRNRLSVK